MLIDEITELLNSIKQTGRVNQSLVTKLDELSSLFKEHKEKWLMSSNTRINLYFYYAARIAELIASRARERFRSSIQVGENVNPISDPDQIMGLLGEVLSLTQKKLPDETSVKAVVEKAKQLRATATNAELLEASEKELEDVDKLLSYISKLRK